MRVLRHEDGMPSKGSNIEGSDYRTLGDTLHCSIRTVVLTGGQSTKYHSHKREDEMYVVLEGRGVAIDGEGKIQEVTAGEFVHFPEGEFHAIGCQADGSRLYFLSIITPPIKDVEFRDLPDGYLELLVGKSRVQ